MDLAGKTDSTLIHMDGDILNGHRPAECCAQEDYYGSWTATFSGRDCEASEIQLPLLVNITSEAPGSLMIILSSEDFKQLILRGSFADCVFRLEEPTSVETETEFYNVTDATISFSPDCGAFAGSIAGYTVEKDCAEDCTCSFQGDLHGTKSSGH